MPALPQLPTPTAEERFDATVKLHDRALFRVYDSSAEGAIQRAESVNARLNDFLSALSEGGVPETRVRTINNDLIVSVGGEPLLTVTQADIAGYGKAPLDVARYWAQEIEAALSRVEQEARPGYFRQALHHAAYIVLLGLIAHLSIWAVARRLLDRPVWPLLILVWIWVLQYVIDLFPQTRPLYNLLTVGVLNPLFIAVVMLLAAIAVKRLWGGLLVRIFPPLSGDLSTEERAERTLLRRMTLVSVARVTGDTVIWVVAILIGLAWAGVNLPALLTSAGLIGVALGFAAQDTLKDMVAGINILLDDRFGVGDVIRVGEYTGKVEALNLRVTQIRDLSGRLITFPNRTIEVVANLTSSWSQVDFIALVGYETDLRKAMDLMEETAENLTREWPEQILEPPQVLGVDAYNDSNIALRMVVRTAPGDQWKVQRELQLRVKEAFEAEGISPPYPRRALILDNEEGGGKENGDDRRKSEKRFRGLIEKKEK